MKRLRIATFVAVIMAIASIGYRVTVEAQNKTYPGYYPYLLYGLNAAGAPVPVSIDPSGNVVVASGAGHSFAASTQAPRGWYPALMYGLNSNNPFPASVDGTGALITTSTGGFVNPMTTLGDIIYGGASGSPTRLAGNTSATKNLLCSTGTGSAANPPNWCTLSVADMPAAMVQGVGTTTANTLLKWVTSNTATSTSASDDGTTFRISEPVAISNNLTANALKTTATCASVGAQATVTCGSAPAGAFAFPIITQSTVTINTTAVTATSQIIVTPDASLSAQTGLTCNNTNPSAQIYVSSRTAGSSFSVVLPGTAPSTSICASFMIIN